MPEKKKRFRRKKIEVTDRVRDIEKLAELHCSEDEIGAFLGVTGRTLRNYKADNPAIAEALIRGWNKGKISIRRAQIQAAVTDRNPSMLIWLGKIMLGQSDRQEVNVSGTLDMKHESSALDQIAGELARIAAREGTAPSTAETGAGDTATPPE